MLSKNVYLCNLIKPTEIRKIAIGTTIANDPLQTICKHVNNNLAWKSYVRVRNRTVTWYWPKLTFLPLVKVLLGAILHTYLVFFLRPCSVIDLWLMSFVYKVTQLLFFGTSCFTITATRNITFFATLFTPGVPDCNCDCKFNAFDNVVTAALSTCHNISAVVAVLFTALGALNRLLLLLLVLLLVKVGLLLLFVCLLGWVEGGTMLRSLVFAATVAAATAVLDSTWSAQHLNFNASELFAQRVGCSRLNLGLPAAV